MNQSKYISETKDHLTASDDKTAASIFTQMIKYFLDKGAQSMEKKPKA